MFFLKRLDKILVRVEGWLIIAFLGLMVFFTFTQVCLRGLYAHGHFQWANVLMGTLDWSEPLARLLVLWLTFLGASLATRENRHIRIDLFGFFLPEKWVPVRELILSVICLLISGIMVKVCMDFVKLEMRYGGTMFANLPAWIGEIIMPVGFSLICFRFMLKAFDQCLEIIRSRKV